MTRSAGVENVRLWALQSTVTKDDFEIQAYNGTPTFRGTRRPEDPLLMEGKAKK
jgi:hypothetical protein